MECIRFQANCLSQLLFQSHKTLPMRMLTDKLIDNVSKPNEKCSVLTKSKGAYSQEDAHNYLLEFIFFSNGRNDGGRNANRGQITCYGNDYSLHFWFCPEGQAFAIPVFLC
jgi:hypothetical protein